MSLAERITLALPMAEVRLMTAAQSRWMRTGLVARRLGVSRPTVQRWCREGLLESRQTPGGQYVVSAASVDAFVARMVAHRAA